MTDRVWATQYRDEATGTLYPFGDGATLTSRDGALVLDRDLFVDASVYPLGGDAGLYLSALDVAARAVTLWVGAPASPRLCSGSFDPLSPPAAIPLADAVGRPAGLLVCDPAVASAAQAWPIGSYAFDADATPFVASCTVALPDPGVRGFALAGGVLVAGAVWLVGKDGVVVGLAGVDPATRTAIVRIDVVGDPLATRRECAGAGLFQAPRLVRTINGVGPDAAGNFAFEVDDARTPDTILRITPTAADTLTIAAAGKQVKD